jgi:hypothetical protein
MSDLKLVKNLHKLTFGLNEPKIDSEETKRRRYQSEFSFGCDLLSLHLEQLSKLRKGVK